MTTLVRIGADTPDNLRLGADLTDRQYLGSDLVWDPAPGGPFSPLDIAWTAALWADQPGFTPPTNDLDPIPSAPDDVSSAGGSWTERDTVRWVLDIASSGKPAFRMNGIGGVNGPALERTPASHVGNDVYIYIIGLGLGSTADIIDSIGASGSDRILLQQSSGSWMLFNGVTQTGGTADNNLHAFYVQFTSGNDKLDVDGTNIIDADAGSHAFANIAVGATGSNTAHSGSEIAFVGVSDTALTAQELSDLATWANTEYGI